MLTTMNAKVSCALNKRLSFRKISYWVLNLLGLVAVLCMLIPVFYMIMMSFRTNPEIAANPLSMPNSLYLGNYIYALDNISYVRSVLNSVGVTLSVTLLVSLLGSMAAYPIARNNNIYVKIILTIVSFGMAVPAFINITPVYVIFRSLGLLDSYIGLIIAFTALNLPLAIFFYIGFISAIPKDLEDAAKLDHCGTIQTYWYVIRPMLSSATATLSLFVMLMVWNDFIYPLLLLTEESKFTVMVSVYRFVGNRNINPELLFPAAVLGSLPLLILFFIFQKRILSGVAAGAVK